MQGEAKVQMIHVGDNLMSTEEAHCTLSCHFRINDDATSPHSLDRLMTLSSNCLIIKELQPYVIY